MEALSEFQTDPGAAKRKYGHDQDVTLFFKEYFEVMGDHFATLGEQDDKAKQQQQQQQQQQLDPDDSARLNEIMQDPAGRLCKRCARGAELMVLSSWC